MKILSFGRIILLDTLQHFGYYMIIESIIRTN